MRRFPGGLRPGTSQLLAALLLCAAPSVAGSGPADAARMGLAVPVVAQAPERCGPAALEMVLRYYGAGPAAVREAGRAYDPALRGALITDLAAAARRAGYEADVATLAPDSLIALLVEGVPPIVLYQNGRAPLTVPHFGVVTGWDPARAAFTLNDGGTRPRNVGREDLARRWRTAGSQALVVRRRSP
jgi:ABC-type bacteriocin/lantibiotic exporter with double-glycine peptidase domain